MSIRAAAFLLASAPAFACPTVDDLGRGGIAVNWEDGDSAVFSREPDGTIVEQRQQGPLTATRSYGPDGLVRSDVESLEGGPTGSFRYVYSFEPPGTPPSEGDGQVGNVGLFVDGAFVGTAPIAWRAYVSGDLIVGECSFATITLDVRQGPEDDTVITRWLWLTELGIPIMVSWDDGFVSGSLALQSIEAAE